MVRAEGVEPSQAFWALRIFLPTTAFAARMVLRRSLSGLRSGLSLHLSRMSRVLGAARLVSTPSWLTGARLGSGLPHH